MSKDHLQFINKEDRDQCLKIQYQGSYTMHQRLLLIDPFVLHFRLETSDYYSRVWDNLLEDAVRGVYNHKLGKVIKPFVCSK